MPYRVYERESGASALRLKSILGSAAMAIVVVASPTGAIGAATVTAPPITVNGSNMAVAALERENSVFVPARGFFEKLGATVTATHSSFIAKRDGKKLAVLAVGSRTATIFGKAQTLPVAPFVSAGNVMVPLRLVSEAAGASVVYSSSPHGVSVTRAAAAAGAPVAAAAAAGAGAAAVAGAAAPAAAPAATDVAAAAPVAATQTNQGGLPWWVWALLALLLLALLVWALARRKKEPVITTTRTPRGSEPTISTSGTHDEPTITTRK